MGRLEKHKLLFQSPEKSYFSNLQKKYCLLKEKILRLYLRGAHHRAYYYCFGGTKKGCLYFLCYGALPLSLVPGPFPLRFKVFLVNVKNKFFFRRLNQKEAFVQPTHSEGSYLPRRFFLKCRVVSVKCRVDFRHCPMSSCVGKNRFYPVSMSTSKTLCRRSLVPTYTCPSIHLSIRLKS